MPERFGHGEWPDPDSLPDHLRRLHRKIQAHARASRQARVPELPQDESGRSWPGLVKKSRRTNR